MARRITLVVGLFAVGGLVLASVTVLLMLEQCTRSGGFVCTSNGACISAQQKCNGVPDCPGGEDELFYICGDLHGSKCGKSHTLIESMRNSTRKVISPPIGCALRNVTKGCKCRRGTQILCLSLNDSQIPSDIEPPEIVTDMLLNGGNFSLQEYAFSPYKLKYISLSGHIEMLDPRAFSSQIRLKILVLHSNSLETLPMGLFIDTPNLEELRLHENTLNDSIFPVLEHQLPNLRELSLSGNNIRMIGIDFPFLPNVVELSMDHNLLEGIEENTFANLKILCYLDLNRNQIRSIHPRAFVMLEYLTEVNLSYNQLTFLPDGVFGGNFSRLTLDNNPLLTLSGAFGTSPHTLKSLNLEGIEFQNMTVMDNLIELDYVHFATFQYCVYAPHAVTCLPSTDGVSSKQDLLMEGSVRTCVWTIASFTSVGNLIVLLGRGFFHEENKVPNIFVRNLAAADLLMGIYLLGIGSVDWSYRNEYRRYSHTWLSSWACTSLGIVATIATEVSILLLAFISMERFLCITCPFSNHKLNPKKAALSLTLIWCLGIALAVIPVFRWPHAMRYYGSNGFCFPLHIDEPFGLGWQYSTFIIYGINGTCMLLIFFTYGALFASIHSTRCATPIRSTNADWDLALRFFFIVFTNCLCLAPIMTIKTLVLLHTTRVSPELSAWLIVFILPINAALNPFLYTFTTSRFRNLLQNVFAKCLVHQRSYRLHANDTEIMRMSLSARNSFPSGVTGRATDSFCTRTVFKAPLLPNKSVKHCADTLI